MKQSHADPRGRERFGETYCKSETNLKKKSSTSDVKSTFVGPRQWNDIGTQESMILVVFKCRNSSLDDYDTVKKFIEKMMEQSIMTKLLMNARTSYPTILNIGQTR